MRQSYTKVLAVVAAISLVFSITGGSAWAGDIEDCNRADGDNQQKIIEACSRVLVAGRLDRENTGRVYFKRGMSHSIAADMASIASAVARSTIGSQEAVAKAKIEAAARKRESDEHHRQAIADFAQASEFAPAQQGLHNYLRAESFEALEDYEAAAANMTAVINMNPKIAVPGGDLTLNDYYAKRMSHWRKLKKWDQAFADWKASHNTEARIKYRQELMAKGRLYSGPVDGKLSPEFERAIKRCLQMSEKDCLL